MIQALNNRVLMFMLLSLIMTALIIIPVYSVATNELDIVIVYDPMTDSGIVVYNLKLDTALDELSTIRTQLIGGEYIDIISVTDNQGEELLYEYDETTREIEILANDTDMISITYEISGLFEEIGVGAYMVYIDLASYSNISIRVEIDLIGKYTIYSEPSNIEVQQDEELTIVILDNPLQYVLVVTETLPTDIGTETTTTTATTTTSRTSTETITTTSSPITTETTTTTTTTTTSSTETPTEELTPSTIMLIIAVVALLIIIIGAIIARKK
ncbi:MAG: hypothetical protein J7L82_06870 [Staphylothermus sp.]|nr:hypothetical protein [Staphylothermus sp.]